MAGKYFRPKRGTKTQIATDNPVLADGEIIFEKPSDGSGTGNIKMGDGTTAYNSLPYFFRNIIVSTSNADVNQMVDGDIWIKVKQS